MIHVSKPFIPPQEEYEDYISGIWQRDWLTNHGPLVNELELKLKKYFNVNHFLFLTNGTLALQIAYKAMELSGEVITTPFSYVATTSSLVWEGLKPVFVDIDPETYNIDPDKIEAAISKNTSAIVATHVFGNPCAIDRIQAIADKHQLKVIYDAAHCFGVLYKGKSILEYGDISIISFHATKLFHTVEGGAVVTRDPKLLKKVAYLRNFGHDGYEAFNGLGINGKNSEFHAAMGLCNLKYAAELLEKYKYNYQLYMNWFKDGPFIQFQGIQEDSVYNFAYFPLVLVDEGLLLKIKNELENHQVFARRYFYPSLNKLEYIDKQSVPIAESLSTRILCLPMSFSITSEEIDMIARLVLRVIKN